MSQKTQDNYRCQKCRQPLEIHHSLNDLSPTQVNLLINNSNANGRTAAKADDINIHSKADSAPNTAFISEDRINNYKQALSSSTNKNVVGSIGIENPTTPMDSFVLLPNKGIKASNNGSKSTQHKDDERYDDDPFDDKHTISRRVKTLENLFDALSLKYEIDYPVCSECANILIEQMKAKLDQTTKERNLYVQFLKKLKSQASPEEERIKQSLEETKSLEQEKQEALEELRQLEEEQRNVEKEYEELKKQELELNEEENQFWQKWNELSVEMKEQLEEKERVNSQYDYDSRQLEKLQRTNVYNDIFHISHDGKFGTINGLRLGSLDNCKVPWPEINAALGQTVLLIATLVQRLNFKLDGYRLRPMGSTSKIEKIERDIKNPIKYRITVLELYSSGDYTIERLFNHGMLDAALIALLAVIQQVASRLKELDSRVELPYSISRDKIGGASIKLSARTANVEWTMACKFLLTNVKYILAYSSAQIVN